MVTPKERAFLFEQDKNKGIPPPQKTGIAKPNPIGMIAKLSKMKPVNQPPQQGV